LLKVLDECDDITSFDKAHLLMADELVAVSAEAISFSEAAYWIDMAYAYLLVSEKFILSERKAALLHAPVSPKTLLEDSKKDDKTAYLFFQNDGRSEWALIHISPIYFYLESVYSSAHPIVGKKENNPA
jgi:isochorismate synthase EntC